MMMRGYRDREPFAATNLAISYFNIGDLAGYRHWLTRAAAIGEMDAEAELKRFETRKPQELARRLGRHRPYRRDGS